jgi:lipoprotein-anchoring transpeptidase ErfK/SrfK
VRAGAALALVGLLPVSDALAARTVVTIRERAELHASPGGPLLSRGRDPLSESGSAWVVRRQGAWLGIPTTQRRSGALAWIRRSPMQHLSATRLLVRVDLSARRVWVTDGGYPVMSAPVAIGAPRSPSPVGSTSVSGRIAVTPSSGLRRSAMGPVVVALRRWQPRASPGLPLGGVMAFHGGANPRVGSATTGGCFRMRDADLVRLARFVRAGTPVIVAR